MKKTSALTLLLLCLVLTACGQSSNTNKELPESKGWVNDFENILTAENETYLDSLISAYEKRTQIEIAIVTIDSSMTSSEDFDAYTLALANHWGVGKKELNNGVLIGVSATLRKIRIQNGLGIETVLSDEETKEIIETFIIPLFKKGAYYQGIESGTLEMMRKLE